MNRPTVKYVGAAIAVGVLVAGCAALLPGDPDERWVDYKSWTKLTDGKVGTGDPTGFIGNVHKGPEGYREVYVNDIGKEALEGSAPYNFPAGTVVVKEQYKNEAAWQADKGGELTISLKMTGSDAPNKDNWVWAAGYTGTAEKNAFCSGCHSIATATDFVFTNGDFLAKN